MIGAAYGTAKSSVGISNMGVLKPDYVMRAIIPVIFAGALGVYGLIIAVILAGNRMYIHIFFGSCVIYHGVVDKTDYPLKKSFEDLAAGLTVGLCGMASGICYLNIYIYCVFVNWAQVWPLESLVTLESEVLVNNPNCIL